MFLDAATVQENLENVEGLQSQVHEDPSDALAFSQLEHAYLENGSRDDLLQLWLSRAETVTDDEERVSLLRKAAKLCQDDGDPASALMVLLTAFDVDRKSQDLADDLDQLAYITGEWDEVLDAYLLAAARSEDAQISGNFWLRIACAHALVTGDTDSLSAALEQVESVNREWAGRYLDLVERQANRIDLLKTFARLGGRIGDHERQVRCLTRCIAMSDTPADKAQLHVELGEIHVDSDDRIAANWHLREALRLDPDRHDARAALIAMSKDEGDFRTAADMLRSEALAGRARKSEAAFEAAKLYSDLEENTQCFDLLSVAMREDPHHIEAAMPLADRYYREERWAELAPLLELLVSNPGHLPAGAPPLFELHLRGARCGRELGDANAALYFAEEALAIDHSSLRAKEERCNALAKLGRKREAIDLGLEIASLQDAEERPTPMRAEHLLHLARWQRELGELGEACRSAERALSVDRSSLEGAEILAELYEEHGDYRRSLETLGQLIQSVEIKRQVELHCERARLFARHLGDPKAALEEYQRGLEKRPGDRRVLNSLLELQTAAELWSDAVDTILQIAKLETDPLKRGKYYDAAGHVAAKHLRDGRCIGCYNQALDCFFGSEVEMPESMRAGCMRPFHRLVDFLHQGENHKELEKNYRRMIKRLAKDDPEVILLWKELGQLYRGPLNRPAEAIASYEVVSALDESTDHKKELLQLYEESGHELDKVISHRLEALEREPMVAENYAALADLYMRVEEPDRAWLCARALVCSGNASEAHKSFYFQYRPSDMVWPRAPLNAVMWRSLRHPGEQQLMNQVLELLADPLLVETSADEQAVFSRDGQSQLHSELRDLVGGVAYAMGLPPLRVVVDLEMNGDLVLVHTLGGPIVAVGRLMWQAPSIRARVYLAVRKLSFLRPHARVHTLARGPADLELIFMAAMTLVRSDIAVDAAQKQAVGEIRKRLRKHIPKARRVRLAHAVNTLISSGHRHHSEHFWQGVSCTAHRAALLVSGDMQAARDLGPHTAMQESEWQDLMLFSVSPTMGDLRRDLRIGLEHNS